MIIRSPNNPILNPKDIPPSRPDFKVDGVFNAGVVRHEGQVLLLLRVAESVISTDATTISIPYIKKGKIKVASYDKKKDTHIDFSDSRKISYKETNKIFHLTSLSHLRIARSTDGIHFRVDKEPWFLPDQDVNTWGVEDPRITPIEGRYYITYSAVSAGGVAVALTETEDFISYTHRGIIFSPENKDVALFPEKIGGLYYIMHRPVPRSIGDPDIWIASSPDLIHWGNHTRLLGSTEDSWENGRIGGGAPPFLTEKGWIAIYHGVDKDARYCLGALLLDANNPSHIIARTKNPIMEPETSYEKEGFFGEVVFTCGLLYEDGIVKIYYGAADETMALAEMSIDDLYRALGL